MEIGAGVIVVLGDLIADLSLHIPRFPVQAEDMHPLEFLALGPGGACNVAIMAARFGLEVGCLGEVGQDRFGELVVEGLHAEGIDTEGVVRCEATATPLAGVLVDRQGEPAYLGYRGSLQLRELTPEWKRAIQSAEALFADGWIEHDAAGQMILEAFGIAQAAGVPTFFDPGPGNPRHDLEWQSRALFRTDVLLLNQAEAVRLGGEHEPQQALLAHGPRLVMIKRGAAGCLAATPHQVWSIAGHPVEHVLDSTGAGDSFDGAVIYGYLAGLELDQIAKLANAAGAAKVAKRGTGRNLPTPAGIKQVLDRAGERVVGWKPSLPEGGADE